MRDSLATLDPEAMADSVKTTESTKASGARSLEGQRATGEACWVCAGKLAFAFTAREMMLGTRDAFDYLACPECGALRIASAPENPDRYYSTDSARDYYTDRQYADHHLTDLEHTARSRRTLWLARVIRGVRRAWSRIRIKRGGFIRRLSGRRYARFDWFRKTGTGLDDAILDVGCGSGRLLTRMAEAGFSQLVGIDPRWPDGGSTRPDVRFERPGVRFERAGAVDHVGEYKLVMAHHSFEHMPNPASAFEAMARLVAPGGGHLLLRVPLADSWARQHYGADWVQLDAPRHLHIPTRTSIALLAERFGLTIVHEEDDSGPFQIWGSEVYRRDRSLMEAGRRGGRVLSRWERGSARWQARRLSRAGRGDQATFYLRRD